MISDENTGHSKIRVILGFVSLTKGTVQMNPSPCQGQSEAIFGMLQTTLHRVRIFAFCQESIVFLR